MKTLGGLTFNVDGVLSKFSEALHSRGNDINSGYGGSGSSTGSQERPHVYGSEDPNTRSKADRIQAIMNTAATLQQKIQAETSKITGEKPECKLLSPISACAYLALKVFIWCCYKTDLSTLPLAEECQLIKMIEINIIQHLYQACVYVWLSFHSWTFPIKVIQYFFMKATHASTIFFHSSFLYLMKLRRINPFIKNHLSLPNKLNKTYRIQSKIKVTKRHWKLIASQTQSWFCMHLEMHFMHITFAEMETVTMQNAFQ